MKNLKILLTNIQKLITNNIVVMAVVEKSVVGFIAVSNDGTEFTVLLDLYLLEQTDIENLDIIAKFYTKTIELGLGY